MVSWYLILQLVFFDTVAAQQHGSQFRNFQSSASQSIGMMMAFPTNISSKYDILNPYVYSTVWGCKWIGDISFSFGLGESPSISDINITGTEIGIVWSNEERAAAREVLKAYSNVCNISLVEKLPDNYATANLVVYKVTQNTLHEVSGFFEAPDGSQTGINTCYGLFNTDSPYWINFTAGGSGYELLLHEFGHALGLAHPHDGGSGFQPKPYPGISIHGASWQDMGSYFLNQGIWSTMSYNNGWLKFPDGVETGIGPSVDKSYGYQSTPMAFDVAALQFLYGANMQYRTGSDTYTLPDINAIGTSWVCIWDAGGIDAISNEGSTLASIIDLREATITNSPNGGGYASHGQGVCGGYTIAHDVHIENAVGGSGADRLIGNSLNNQLVGNDGNDMLTGGPGNDQLDGGTGIDTANYIGTKTQYLLNDTNNVITDIIAGRDGNDTLKNIERIRFADTAIALDIGIGESVGEVYRLYFALLDRNPEDDFIGTGYWIDRLDRSILTTEQVAACFLDSTEFVTRFGSTAADDDSFVNMLYTTILDRDGHLDPGFSFWLNALKNHLATREQVVIGFMDSAECVAKTALIIGNHATYQPWEG